MCVENNINQRDIRFLTRYNGERKHRNLQKFIVVVIILFTFFFFSFFLILQKLRLFPPPSGRPLLVIRGLGLQPCVEVGQLARDRYRFVPV
jgi:hypothetical protein